MLGPNNSLSTLTIYDSPRDCHGRWVVRECHIGPGTLRMAPIAFVFGSLNAARRWCVSSGLIRLPREPGDDTVIVETWI